MIMKKKILIIVSIVVLFIGTCIVHGVNIKTENEPSSSVIIDNMNFDTQTFTPSDDTFIRMKDPGNNYGSSESIQVRNRYGYSGHPYYWEHDILIRFDISSISSNSIINSANLNIFYCGWADSNPSGRELTLHKIIDEWNEDAVTWETQPDYDLEVTSSSFVPSSTGVWMTWDVSSDVQEFVVDPDSNYGWQIMDELAWNTFDIPNSKFRSKEYSENGNDFLPYLEIEVIDPHMVFIFGRIENLNTEGDFTTFDAVKLRYLQFSPFSFDTYSSGETVTTVGSKIGILTTNFAFGVFNAAI